MRVVIAVDETPESIEAIRTAHRLLGDDPAYTVVTIGEPSYHLIGMDPLGTMTYDVTSLSAPSSANPEQIARAATEATGIDADVITDVGPPGPRICQLASEIGADVLVVGNHDRGFLSRLVAPSVQSHIVDHSPCPVLIARAAEQHQ